MVVSEISLYEMLKSKLGATEAEALVTLIEQKAEKKTDEKKNLIVAEIESKISASEARLTLRMFYFWIGQVGVIAGLLFYLLKK